MFKYQILKASFHRASPGYGRLRPNIQIRPPIEPTIKNIKIKEDHPLWQFFRNGKMLDELKDFEQTRSWTLPELRRKNFEDLHSLFYNCVVERNQLERENHLIKSMYGATSEQSQVDSLLKQYVEVSQDLSLTMKRIKIILNERQSAFENTGKIFKNYKFKFLENFKENYLAEDVSSESFKDLESQLHRLNYGLFGINTNDINLNEIINDNFVDCVLFNSELKLLKFGTAKQQQEFLPVSNVFDAYPVFQLSSETQNELSNILELVKENRSLENYESIKKLVPVKQLEEAILTYEN